MGFLSAAAGIAGIAQTGLGIFQAIKGDEDLEDAQKAAQRQAEQDTRGLEFRLEAAKAQQDPTHPWFLALRDSRRDINQRLFQSGIEDFMRSHRRNLAIGGPGSIVSPDRRDENLFRAFGRQRATYDPAAEARSILAQAGNTTGGSTGGAAVAGSLAQSQRDVESGGIANIFAGIPA